MTPSRKVVERFARAKCSDPSCTEVGWWAGNWLGWLGWVGLVGLVGRVGWVRWVGWVGWVGLDHFKWRESTQSLPFENCVIFWDIWRKNPSENWHGSLKKGDALGCYAFSLGTKGGIFRLFSRWFPGVKEKCRELFLNLGAWIPYPQKKQLESSGSQLQIRCLWRKFAVQKTGGYFMLLWWVSDYTVLYLIEVVLVLETISRHWRFYNETIHIHTISRKLQLCRFIDFKRLVPLTVPGFCKAFHKPHATGTPATWGKSPKFDPGKHHWRTAPPKKVV